MIRQTLLSWIDLLIEAVTLGGYGLKHDDEGRDR